METEQGTVLGWGYRVHVIVDADSEAPVSVVVTPANVNDVTAWPGLHRSSLQTVPWNRVRYFAADGGYAAEVVRGSFPYPLLRVVVPPARAPEPVERFFPLLNGFFSLRRFGVTGLERVRAWVLLACLAATLVLAANRRAGRPLHSVKGFLREIR